MKSKVPWWRKDLSFRGKVVWLRLKLAAVLVGRHQLAVNTTVENGEFKLLGGNQFSLTINVNIINTDIRRSNQTVVVPPYKVINIGNEK